MSLITLLVYIIVFAVVAGLIFWLLGQLPLPAPWAQVIRICAVLICVLLLLGILFGGIDAPHLNIR